MKKILIIALFLMAALGSAKRMRAQVVVIANPSVKSADISRNDLRDVFTGITSNLKDGSHVVPVLLKDGPTNEAFLHDYVEKSDTAYRAGWRSMTWRAGAETPSLTAPGAGARRDASTSVSSPAR